MIIRIQHVISILWSFRVISAADNAEVPQECELSLPAGYSKLIPPVHRNESGGSLIPVVVDINFAIIEVSSINDDRQEMKLSFFLRMSWEDYRILDATSCDGLTSSENMDKFWIPRIYYYHTEEMEYVGHVEDETPRITHVQDGRFVKSFTAKTILLCELEFEWYPFDKHECLFRFGSPSEPDTLVHINSSLDDTMVTRVWGVQGVTQYLMSYEETKELKVMYGPGVYHSVGGVKISLSRRPSHFVLNVFIPTGTLVLVSLMSFVVHFDSIPGRVAILCMTLLTLLNASTSARESSPNAKEATVLDLWLNTCLLFNLVAVFEYAALLYKKSNLNGKVDGALSLVDLESFNAFGRRMDRMFCVGLLLLFSLVTTLFMVVILVHSSI